MGYFPWLCEITRGYPPVNLNQDNYENPVFFQHHLRCIFHIWVSASFRVAAEIPGDSTSQTGSWQMGTNVIAFDAATVDQVTLAVNHGA
jgi:hypothetical protein